MLTGTINADGLPIIDVLLGGTVWQAVVDTGFNGDLELPDSLRIGLHPRWKGQGIVFLGGGQMIWEDQYEVSIPFDGQIRTAEVGFSSAGAFLIGTRFLQGYRLEINFVTGTVLLERVAP